MITIHDERPVDVASREALLDRAFGPTRRQKTCERMREGRRAAEGLSLVAVQDGELVGTLRFWHVAAGPGRPALVLGPLAVDQDRRGSGIGAALIREGLARARALGFEAVLLVGDAPYYERFGFSAGAVADLTLPGPFERERFLGLDLVPGALQAAAGLVQPTGAAMESAGPVVAQAGRRRAA